MKTALLLWVALGAAALAAFGGSCANERTKPNQSHVGSDSMSVPSTSPHANSGWRSDANASSLGSERHVGKPMRDRGQFVGSARCASCHQVQSEAYLTSHHAKALVDTNTHSTQAHFDGTHFSSKLGGITTFTQNDAVASVHTPVAKGKSATLPVPYVSGVWPLQQYVVATERGKLQSLGVVWDSRSAQQGGNRWFHVYGANGIAPDDPLFFTHATQNWNHMCADCHSTWVSRGYDVASDAFDTKWAELSVGCEACHGPGAEHVESALQNPAHPARFTARLKRAEPWGPSVTGSPVPRSVRESEVEACAPCHSRRAPLAEGFVASDLLLDHFEPELLWPGRYHADGQVEGEVYEWGSFTQSRMYQAGVTCSDCHDPHSGKPYAAGDALCGRCHEPKKFQTLEHSHHSGTNAPRCIDCHMPPATFMQVDERRDHSIRIPRPDHSVAFGTPNACNTCHAKQDLGWAREWTRKWYPTLEERAHFVQALGKDRVGAPDAPQALRKLALDVAAPAIARATALDRLGNYPNSKTLETLRTALGSIDNTGELDGRPRGGAALVAFGAVLGATQLAPAERLGLVAPALKSDVRAVRIASAKALAGVPSTALPVNAREAFARAVTEVETSFEVSASRAETHVERSAFALARMRFDEAEAALQTALRLSPCLVEAHLNLAELMRQRKDETRAALAIRAALECDAKSAAAHHALGLLQVRTKHPESALDSLAKAVELAPTDARFSYVLSVALGSAGKAVQAVRVLDASLGHHPNDVQSLQVLSRYLRDIGDTERAVTTERRLRTLSTE